MKNTSPTPKKTTLETVNKITFEKAIASVIGGRKITKLEWGDIQYYGLLKDGYLMLHKPDGKHYQWILNEGDLLGDDWVVLPE